MSSPVADRAGRRAHSGGVVAAFRGTSREAGRVRAGHGAPRRRPRGRARRAGSAGGDVGYPRVVRRGRGRGDARRRRARRRRRLWHRLFAARGRRRRGLRGRGHAPVHGLVRARHADGDAARRRASRRGHRRRSLRTARGRVAPRRERRRRGGGGGGAGRAAVAAPVLPLSQRAGSGVHHEPARGPVLADVDRRHAPGRAAAARARARCPATGISSAAAVLAAVAHPHTPWRPDGTGAAATNLRCLARPALRPVWSRTARIPACGLCCGTAGARQSPSSGDESLGKGI